MQQLQIQNLSVSFKTEQGHFHAVKGIDILINKVRL